MKTSLSFLPGQFLALLVHVVQAQTQALVSRKQRLCSTEVSH